MTSKQDFKQVMEGLTGHSMTPVKMTKISTDYMVGLGIDAASINEEARAGHAIGDILAKIQREHAAVAVSRARKQGGVNQRAGVVAARADAAADFN